MGGKKGGWEGGQEVKCTVLSEHYSLVTTSHSGSKQWLGPFGQ